MWEPELKADTSGFVQLTVPLADSITTWRVTALASTQDGKLGLSNAALRVFQDFFVGIDLPVALTQYDEVAISSPFTTACPPRKLIEKYVGDVPECSCPANLATRDAQGAHWGGENTMMGGYGQTGAVESTALAAHALIRGGKNLALAQDALAFIVKSKDSWGTWHSTQATIWALKALMLSASAGDVRDAQATVSVSLNGRASTSFQFTPENADVVRVVTFDDVNLGENRVSIDVSGKGSLMYQVTAIYYLPWSVAPPEPEPIGLLSVDVNYDRTTVQVDDLVTVGVRARLTRPGTAKMVLLDLGVPPGFTVQADDLNALVEEKSISRYDLTGRQIILYVENLSSEQTLDFKYRLKARFPLRAKTQPYSAYDYYNPDQPTHVQPTLVTVQARPSP